MSARKMARKSIWSKHFRKFRLDLIDFTISVPSIVEKTIMGLFKSTKLFCNVTPYADTVANSLMSSMRMVAVCDTSGMGYDTAKQAG